MKRERSKIVDVLDGMILGVIFFLMFVLFSGQVFAAGNTAMNSFYQVLGAIAFIVVAFALAAIVSMAAVLGKDLIADREPRELQYRRCKNCHSPLTEPEDGPNYCEPCCIKNYRYRKLNSSGQPPPDEHWYGPF